MDTSVLLALGLTLVGGLLLGVLVGLLWARSRQDVTAGMVDQAEVMQGLDRLSDQLQHLDRERASWQGQLHQQVLDMRLTTDSLRRETTALSQALRKPQVRGRWGEMHLRRAVELAGLVDRCDFTEQHRLDDGALRPDLVVHLSGGRSLVLDAKVPLDAFLDATAADDEDQREAHLLRHARQLRGHVDALGAKRYWRALPGTPEFVVMFLPGEAFLSAALEGDRDLLEYAATRQVVLATPTTLIALLRTVARGWLHEGLADRAREIHEIGRGLHDRLATLGGHLDRLGRALSGSVQAYNQAVGSLEGRVLVQARRMADLGEYDATDLEGPRQIDALPRSLGPAGEPPARRAPGA